MKPACPGCHQRAFNIAPEPHSVILLSINSPEQRVRPLQFLTRLGSAGHANWVRPELRLVIPGTADPALMLS
ncbi:uncharacterized protein METZ01_LOCUS222591 [marine metagenome]|uniref:Uncharacterized protein n=1 Tax=marine metagenome TaxID=408172 RepID=A0A382G5A0_9ZZZZ